MLEVHHYRYATKKFDSTKKVSDEDFNTIMEAARLSPSSFGFEPWKFLLINSEKIREDLKPFSWGAVNSLNGASHFVIGLIKKNITVDSPLVKHIIEDVWGSTLEEKKRYLHFFQEFQENDFKLLNNPRALFDWSSKQSYLALANMMTTAAFLGIDSCPIEGFNHEKAEQYFSEIGVLDTSEYGISFMVSFGYRDEVQPPKTRQSMSEILEVIS
ncbi:NAD(P)H-dependent oxidoreductase [Paenibacillus lautus]|uniref:NAD(P)H-dependent oxidoreductase n=1 Tax=Paenibacillus lautus TaxID=1401 RepID=UPI003D2B2ABA